MVAAGTKYGLRFAVELASRWGSGPVDARSAAERRGIPEAYLRKIAAALKRAGVVEADRGQTGGYRLAKDPALLSAADIFAALETPSAGPAAGDESCDGVWDRMEAAAIEALKKETLRDLADAPDGGYSWSI